MTIDETNLPTVQINGIDKTVFSNGDTIDMTGIFDNTTNEIDFRHYLSVRFYPEIYKAKYTRQGFELL